jgi:acetyl-CoA synthetase
VAAVADRGWAPIAKDVSSLRVPPNLPDYERAREAFSWRAARGALHGLPRGRGLNIAYEAVDRHVRAGHADRVALRRPACSGERLDVTYGDLAAGSSQFANALRRLGVKRGDRVFACCDRRPELHVAALGTLKRGAVFCPLPPGLGADALRERLALGEGRVLVTTAALYERQIDKVRVRLPELAHVLVAAGEPPRHTLDMPALLADEAERYDIPPTDPEDPALLHFTGGRPKGALHVHDAIVGQLASSALALDLHRDDVFWCTADAGSVNATAYGVLAPLAHGLTSIVDEAEFDATRCYRILAEERVTVWCTTPAAVSRLMRAGVEPPDLPALRFVASVGEPVPPEAVLWGERALGLPIHQNWSQTEAGGIALADFAATEIRPGSMGRPLPGIDATLLVRDAQGRLVCEHGRPIEVDAPDAEGELALRAGWPSMFRGYLDAPALYRERFLSGWYRTGEPARRDPDGYYWPARRRSAARRSSSAPQTTAGNGISTASSIQSRLRVPKIDCRAGT